MQENLSVETNVMNGVSKKRLIVLMIVSVITLIVWNLPLETFGIEGLTIVQRRMIAIFVFAALAWLTEAIPSWATSLVILAVMCLSISNNAFNFLKSDDPQFGELLKSKEIMSQMANPIIILFLGGFVLARVAQKSGLDVLLARTLLRPFGHKSDNILLGFLLITGIFSMFVSNTATAAMMLTLLTPVFAALPSNGRGRIALTLCIPVAANIGGMATPIGTPPNAIALQALNDPAGLNMGMGFGQWMSFMFPLTIFLLFISWVILKKMFPFTKPTIELDINGKIEHGWRMWVIGITFAVTILMWLLDKVTGVDANTVALIPMAAFGLTGIINAKDIQMLDWSVIWMVAGGFALGLGLNGSGLAAVAIESIPFDAWSPLVVLIISGLICYLLSNFISNTATAALLVPILIVVCSGMGESLTSIGGESTIIIGIAIAASSAMCLPISTPPNAIAYSTGLVEQKYMLRVGLLMGIVSMVLGYGLLIMMGKFGSDVSSFKFQLPSIQQMMTLLIILVLAVLVAIAVAVKRIKDGQTMNMEVFARKNLGEEFAESEKYVSRNPRFGFYIDKQRDKIALIRVNKEGKFEPKVIDDFHCDKVIEHVEFVHDKYFFAEDRVRQKALLWALINSSSRMEKSAKLKVVHYSDIRGVEMYVDNYLLYNSEGSAPLKSLDELTRWVDKQRDTQEPFSDVRVRVRFSEQADLGFTFECMTANRASAERTLTARHLLSVFELVKTLAFIIKKEQAG